MRTLERSVGTTSTGPGADEVRSRDTGTDVGVASAIASAAEQLRELLDAAAALDDADDRQAVLLRSAARRTTQRLVAAGLLPAALAVDDTDPPVVVVRLLSRAWRHAARSAG